MGSGSVLGSVSGAYATASPPNTETVDPAASTLADSITGTDVPTRRAKRDTDEVGAIKSSGPSGSELLDTVIEEHDTRTKGASSDVTGPGTIEIRTLAQGRDGRTNVPSAAQEKKVTTSANDADKSNSQGTPTLVVYTENNKSWSTEPRDADVLDDLNWVATDAANSYAPGIKLYVLTGQGDATDLLENYRADGTIVVGPDSKITLKDFEMAPNSPKGYTAFLGGTHDGEWLYNAGIYVWGNSTLSLDNCTVNMGISTTPTMYSIFSSNTSEINISGGTYTGTIGVSGSGKLENYHINSGTFVGAPGFTRYGAETATTNGVGLKLDGGAKHVAYVYSESEDEDPNVSAALDVLIGYGVTADQIEVTGIGAATTLKAVPTGLENSTLRSESGRELTVGNHTVDTTGESGSFVESIKDQNDDEYVTIVFDVNGGTGSVDNIRVKKSEAYLTTPEYPEIGSVTKENRAFLGWYPEKLTDIDRISVYFDRDKLNSPGDPIVVLTFSDKYEGEPQTYYAIWGYDLDGDGVADYQDRTDNRTESGDAGDSDTPPSPSQTPDDGSSGNSSSGGSSSGGSSGGGTASRGTVYVGGTGLNSGSTSSTQWTRLSDGHWTFRQSDGSNARSEWVEAAWNGMTRWYHFDANGYCQGGWFQDTDGKWYYLHPYNDGDFGYMYIGWALIDGSYYYFSQDTDPSSDPKYGEMLANTTTPDGYYVDSSGRWVQQ